MNANSVLDWAWSTAKGLGVAAIMATPNHADAPSKVSADTVDEIAVVVPGAPSADRAPTSPEAAKHGVRAGVHDSLDPAAEHERTLEALKDSPFIAAWQTDPNGNGDTVALRLQSAVDAQFAGDFVDASGKWLGEGETNEHGMFTGVPANTARVIVTLENPAGGDDVVARVQRPGMGIPVGGAAPVTAPRASQGPQAPQVPQGETVAVAQ